MLHPLFLIKVYLLSLSKSKPRPLIKISKSRMLLLMESHSVRATSLELICCYIIFTYFFYLCLAVGFDYQCEKYVQS